MTGAESMPRIRGEYEQVIIPDGAGRRSGYSGRRPSAAFGDEYRVFGEVISADFLSNRGAIDSRKTTIQPVSDCGCLAAPAGRCIECGALVCARCFSRCARCRCPLCPQHGLIASMPDGMTTILCRGCLHETRRRRRFNRMVKAVLGFFVEVRDGSY
jgi:hypothetical protein